ncbi:hypothetical protein M422DRAFT_155416 [Sphaerobolus stellatus SS14]|nr:hypothetical protein M422DRAFT_155416 [Sphaerobolus stellatus SS14]
MWFHGALCLIMTFLCLVSANPSIHITPTHIRVNALIGKNGAAGVQCWQVEPPLGTSQQSGTVGRNIQQLGNIKGATIVFFNATAPSTTGLHTAPAPQWVVTIAGRGVLILPSTGQKIPLLAGSIIIANDTAAVAQVGHNNYWVAGSAVMQLPFENGIVNHTVVNDGICR